MNLETEAPTAPLTRPGPSRLDAVTLFLVACSLAAAFAAYTGHVWEDFYITYRSSKNLVEGNGLVFTPGERLHTFTSPLGVLLPAAASVLTGANSDAAAINVFRAMSIVAFGGGIVLLYAGARRGGAGRAAALLAASWLALDAKSVDFTINGMETGVLIGFLGYLLWALFDGGSRRWLHLGLAWAGLMWTRPDSFVYIGLSSAAVWLFNDASAWRSSRREWIVTFLKAGLLCTILYLPWFAWAWWYYGSPVPHTILAKSNVSSEPKTLAGLLRAIVTLPYAACQGRTAVEATMLPSYFAIGGWPNWLVVGARVLGIGLALAWLLPFRRLTRVASFVFCGAHVYLAYYPFFPFPWYLPGTVPFAALTLAGIVAAAGGVQWRPGARQAIRGLAISAGALAVGVHGWLTWQMARQMAVEQVWSATGTRMAVGKWLREHADPGQTVFMEPLGHIGYFSRLKTYDFPGLSSLETVRAIGVVGAEWSHLVEYLTPDWLVLRPFEANRMNHVMRKILAHDYRLATALDNHAAIAKHDIYGRPYVEHDARFLIYRRVHSRKGSWDTTLGPAPEFPLPIEGFDGAPQMYKLHADGLLALRAPAGAKRVKIYFGLPPTSYVNADLATDGVHFQIWTSDGRRVVQALGRILSPKDVPTDRGLHTFELDLPPTPGGAEFVLACFRVGTETMDWSCWSWPEFTME